MIGRIIRQSLKQSIHEYMIYFFTLAVGVTAFYSYAVLLDSHFRIDMGLSASFSVLSDKILYAVPFIFLMPTILMIYIERFLYIRKQKALAVFIMSGLRRSKAAYLYCTERMVAAFLGVSMGIVSGGMVSSLILHKYFVYIGENLDIKPLFYPNTIILTFFYFVSVFAVLSIYYIRKMMRSAIADLFRAVEDHTPDKDTGHGSGICALAVCYAGYLYISVIMVCIMSVCFDYFPLFYKVTGLVSVIISILLLVIFIKSRNIYDSIIAAICLGVAQEGALCALYPVLDSLVKGKVLNSQLCYLLVFGMVFLLFSIVFLFYEVFSEILLHKRYTHHRVFSENRIILGDICSNIRVYGKVMAAITLILSFMLALGIWCPIYLERIEGYLHERSVFDMQLFTMISYDKYRNHENSEYINFGPVTEQLVKEKVAIADEMVMETFFVEEQLKEEGKPRLAICVSLSDYNKLLLSLGKPPIVLHGDYAIQWDQEYSEEQMDEARGSVASIMVGDIILKEIDAFNYTYETGMALYTNHMKYVYVIPDSLCGKLSRATSIALYRFCSRTGYETALRLERKMTELFEMTETKVYVRLKTLQETETISVITLIRMVVGYMETALILGCLAMLSVQQLTNILQSGRNYRILHYLGFTREQINKLVFRNEMAWFFMPIISAVVFAMGGVIFSFSFFLEDFLFYSSKDQIFMYVADSYAKIVGISFLYILVTWFAAQRFINKNL